MRGLFFLLVLWMAWGRLEEERLDPAIIEIDLYKQLGVRPDASPAAIRKAYRELAKIYHPDKASSPSKELNAQKFRDIAQAHEVLASAEHRSEYDRERAARVAHGEYHQRRQQQYQQQQQYHQQQQHWQQQQPEYDGDDFYGAFEEEESSYYYNEPGRNIPVVVGSIMRSGQVLMPYSPILLSPDQTYFSFLDSHCSLGVFHGDVNHVLRHLYTHSTLDLTDLPVELMYRTPGDSGLQGQCFATLDEDGVLRVFQGQYDGFGGGSGSILWESTPPKQDFAFFTTFFVELTSSGELAVLSLRTGEPEPECIWSSTACNLYMSILQELRVESMRIVRGAFKIIRGCFRALAKLFDDIILDDKPLDVLRLRALAVARHLKALVTTLLSDFFVL